MSRTLSFNSYKVLDQNAYVLVNVTNVATAATALADLPVDSTGRKPNAATFTVSANAGTSGDAVFVRLDGGVPSPLLGLPLRDAAVYQVFLDELTGIRMVSSDANTQVVRIEYAIVG